MVFDRLPKFKYHVKHKLYEMFSKKAEFLGHTVLAGVLVLFRQMLILLRNSYRKYVSRMYKLF